MICLVFFAASVLSGYLTGLAVRRMEISPTPPDGTLAALGVAATIALLFRTLSEAQKLWQP